MHRLFAALRPPAPIRARLAATMEDVPGARWQDDEQLHLTLRFAGTLDRPLAEDVAAALAQVHAPAVEVALAGVGRFEERGRATALWAGIAPQDALAALHRKVGEALRRVGIAPDPRAYLPHITLARFSRTAGAAPEIERWLIDHAGLASPPFLLSHLVLFESRLGAGGARYEVVERWTLG